MSTSLIPVPPIGTLSNDVLLELFKVIADDTPLFLTPATRTQPAWQLTQVCSLWRSVAGLCKALWHEPHFEFNRETSKYGSEALDHILSQCEEYATRRSCDPLNLSITIIAKADYSSSVLERRLYHWITAHPNRVKSLTVQGVGASDALQRLAYTGPLSHLNCLRIRVVRINELPSFELDFEVLPLLLNSPSTIDRLECVSQCQFEGGWISGERLSLELIPSFEAMKTTQHDLLCHIQDLRLVDCPQLLQYARSAMLTSLDFTCAAAMLHDDVLISALAGVISASSKSLHSLELHGWLPWGDTRLLNSIRGAENLELVTLDFYVTLPMVGFYWTGRRSKTLIRDVNTFWEEVCALPSLKRATIICSIYCDSRVYKEVDNFRVYWVTKPLRVTARQLRPPCEWSIGHRRAETWHGFRPDNYV